MMGAALWLALSAAAPPAEILAGVRVEAPQPDRYAAYLDLAAGDPVDPERVRASVLRLMATGDFEDVVALVEPAPDGATLVFRTRPAPRLRAVRLGGEGGVSAGFVRRAARLRTGEALWPRRTAAIAADTERALRDDGWLDASAEARVAAVADGADLLLQVGRGPRVRLRFSRVDGVPPPLVLDDLVRPPYGEPYRRVAAQEAAERMRSRLADAGYWRAVVELEEARAPGSEWLDLVFRVRSGPGMSVEARGTDLSRGQRSALQGILREGSARGDALEGGAEKIEERLREEGHRDVVVRYRTETEGDEERIVYEVTPGSVATVASVQVTGASDLAALVGIQAGQPLRDDAVAEAARVLTSALRARGHADARVEAVVRDGGGALPVVFRVVPGPATLVSAVRVNAAQGPDAPTAGELSLREGSPYEARLLSVDRGRILSAYRNAGYLDAIVEPQLAFGEDRTRVEVTFEVTPGPRAVTGQVILTGLERTREKVVSRELRLAPGEPLSLDRLLDGQKRLSALGLFERVSLTPLGDEASGQARDVLVGLSEAPVTTISYGVGYSERDLFRGSVEVTRRNLFGLDRTLTAFGRVAFRGQRFVLSYREPFFLGRRRDFFGTAFYDDEDRTTFDFTRIGGIAQTTRRFGETRAVILRLTYQATDVFNVEVPLEEIDREFRTYTLAGPSISLVQDSRDNPLDARRGHFVSADLQLSIRVLGGAQFGKAFFQAARYTRLRRELSVAVSARFGAAATFGSSAPEELPLPERFFAGGDYTIRGFAIDTAGPQAENAEGELFPTGGNGLVLANAELRRDLGRALTLAAFLDVGNVFPLVSDMRLDELRYTAGLGLRYRTPLGPLRLDWGVKLNPRPGESGYRFHLTVGNAY